MVSKPTEHPMDLIIMPLLEMTIGALANKSVIVEGSQDDPSLKIPYIDFVFGYQRWKPEDCDRMSKTQKLKCLVNSDHLTHSS